MPQVSPTRITVGVSEDRDVPIRKKNIHFQWEFPRCLTSICDSDQSEDEEDMAEFHQEFRDRLEEADILTRKMSKEEYIEFAECRQASFTYKKAKKFKDWLGFHERYKPSDDLLDIVGFLLWEFLRKLTIEALALRNRRRKESQPHPTQNSTLSIAETFSRYSDVQLDSLRANSLFYAPSEKCPLTPELMKEAFSNLSHLRVF
ncbi:subunit of transcription initiation factor IID [Mitosporidium daphniae]|uniref:Subunit of transcription initiation factor IID n=1 Tax=Mitosporidium daphniae TaxID=1485682 RepID=A0A098VSA7_9MICR|nr:subunit of transcription initiation factor IID [Mitosporidium daphniae]KGG50631.1 subunit of transcription initiation factor IID [Mitosporidium daphniae]|eukprot:XP_013237058.1 subunit of transcription initiation factor IID [Mitosporidium daphniae]